VAGGIATPLEVVGMKFVGLTEFPKSAM